MCKDIFKSSCLVFNSKTASALARAQTEKVIIGSGSSMFETIGARAVANLETKFSIPKEVDANRVGKTDECAT